VLHDLARQLAEIWRPNTGPVGHIRQHAVKGVAELVEEGLDLVEAQQSRGVLGGGREVADQVDDRIDLDAVGPVLAPEPAAPRTPALALSRVVIDGVRGQWEERFERRFGFWRGFVDEQIRRYLDCGLFENGFARIRCPDCAEEYLLAFSCKTRELCPSCAAKRSAATAALLVEDVLEEVGHAQWVFVIPKMLRPYFLHHRELLLSWRHSGFSVHNRVRVEPEDQSAVERLARYIMRPPISLERMRWDGVGEVRYRRKGGHEDPALNRDPVDTFDPLEFLARVIMHIPEPRRHLARYYGAYSNVSRGRRRKGETEQGPGAVVETAGASRADRDRTHDARALRRSWAQLIKRIYEVDPLVCPSCGSEMKVVAFIIDHAVVDKILRHLKRRGEGQRERGPPERSKLAAVS